MKKKSLILKEKRNDVWKKIVALRKIESRSEDQQTELKDLENDFDGFADSILDAEKNEAREAEMTAIEMAQAQEAAAEERSTDTPTDRRGGRDNRTPEQRAIEEFSFIKAIKQARNGQQLDGIEKEMFDEAKKENDSLGLEMRGNVAVPSSFFKKEKRTALTAATAATAGNLISTDMGGLVDALRPNLVLDQLGLHRMEGLTGNVVMPRQTGTSSAVWAAENATSTQTNPTVDQISLSPNRLTATALLSDTLLRQSSIDAEMWVRNDLNLARSEKLNETILNGSGTGNTPLGILNISGVPTVVFGTDGGVLTHAKVEEFIKLVDDNNGLSGNLGWVLNPSTRYSLKTIKKDAGSGRFLMESNNELAGFVAANTTHMPKNLTKGSGTDLSGMIFGNFNNFILASWGGASMIVDPYSKKTEAQVEVTINSYHDTDYKHKESFAIALDVVT